MEEQEEGVESINKVHMMKQRNMSFKTIRNLQD